VERPWLSVIVPSHDGERWLGAALQSLVDQKMLGIEVILIDASETDESLRIAEGFSDRLDIRTERRPDLLPWTAKTNYGVELATSPWVSMLHQDDLWRPQRSGELRKWLSRQTDAVMHLHPCYIIDETGRRLGLWRCPLTDNGSPVPDELLLERLLVQNFVAIPAPAIRRDAFIRVGGLDNQLWYTADWDLYLKIAAVGNVYYHSTPLACFRVHKGSLTVRGSKDKIDFRRQHQIVVDRHAEKLAAASRKKVLPVASASIEVNVALAAAIGGELAQIFKAMAAMLTLGPRGLRQYFLYSRILDRALPRLRALVAARF
jgi:GT2 family glycosyltransferase